MSCYQPVSVFLKNEFWIVQGCSSNSGCIHAITNCRAGPEFMNHPVRVQLRINGKCIKRFIIFGERERKKRISGRRPLKPISTGFVAKIAPSCGAKINYFLAVPPCFEDLCIHLVRKGTSLRSRSCAKYCSSWLYGTSSNHPEPINSHFCRVPFFL